MSPDGRFGSAFPGSPLAALRNSSPVALLGLLAVNAVPLVGVVEYGWTLHTLLILYWLENGVVGALNVPRILLAGADPPGPDRSLAAWLRGAVAGGNRSTVGFFAFHYGLFWAVHGYFVLLFPAFLGQRMGDAVAGIDIGALAIGTAAMVGSHGLSLAFNYVGRGEYRDTYADEQMTAPYGRVVALHLTIILGAFVAAFLGASTAVLALFVLLKTVADLAAHVREHRGAQSPSAGSGGVETDRTG